MADRYWVGGTAAWDSTAGTKWATSSGGAGGAAVPTSSDNVFFDAASGTVTVSKNGSGACLNLDCTGFTGTLDGGGIISCYGSLTLGASMVYSLGNTLLMEATTTGKTVTTNGVTLNGNAVVFSGVGGEWTLQDNFTSNNAISVTAGTFITNNFNVSVSSFTSSGTVSRTITLGSSTITCTSTGTSFSISGSNLTLNEDTSVIILSGSTGGFVGGGQTYYEVQLTGTGAQSISGANTYTNLKRIGGNAAGGSVDFTATQTITGTLTLTANNITSQRLKVSSDTFGATRTLSAAAVSISGVDFEDITGSGAAAPFTGTSIGDCWGNSGITFDTPVTRYWVGGAGSYSSTSKWSTSSGGASGASVPLVQDTAVIDSNSGLTSTDITLDVLRIGNINWTVANARQFDAGTTISGYGSIESASTVSLFAISSLLLKGRGTHNLKGIINEAITITSPGGSYTLTGDFSSNSGTFTLTSGSLDAATYNVSLPAFNSSNSNVRSLSLGTGTWTITSSSTPWNITTSTNMTLDAGTSTINFTYSGAGARTFAGGGLTYYNINIASGATSDFTFTGSNTFNDLTSTKTNAHNVKFTAGTTNTFANFNLSGAGPSALVTITSATAASHTLAKSGGGTIEINYANISWSTATPGSTWTALNSTDSGNNSGWTIVPIPAFTPFNIFFGNNF